MQRKMAAKLFVPAVAALVLWSGLLSVGQDFASQSTRQLRAPERTALYDDSQTASAQDIELLRQDVRSQKKQMIAANMSFTDAEAEKFWPVYDRYAADLAKIYDRKIALLQEYLENYDSMSGDQSETYLRERATVEEDVMQLRLKYLPEFRKVLSGRQATLFYQIDWRLDLMINLQLAQAPMINP